MSIDDNDPLLDSLLSQMLGGERPIDRKQQILARLAQASEAQSNHWSSIAELAKQDIERGQRDVSSGLPPINTADLSILSAPLALTSTSASPSKSATASNSTSGATPTSEAALTSEAAPTSTSDYRACELPSVFLTEVAAPNQSEAHDRWQTGSDSRVQPRRDVGTDRVVSTRTYWAAGLLAASVLVGMSWALGFWKSSQPEQTPQQVVVHENGVQAKGPNDGSSVIAENHSKQPKEPTHERLPLDNLPSTNTVQASAQSIAAQNPLDDEQIVAVINAQLAYLWKRAGLEPSPAISETEWENRIRFAAYGTLADAPVATEDIAARSSTERLVYLQRQLRDPRFAEHWSEQQVERWLGKVSGAGLTRRAEFVSWLADQTQRGESSLEIQRRILAARGADASVVNDFHPAVYFWGVMGEHSKEWIADRIGRMMFDQVGACARCHDVLSIDGSRDAFWGLVALLQSIKLDTLEQDGIRFRRVSYRNPSEVFYALPDQTMRAALPRLPSGTLFGSHVTNTGSEPIDAMQVLANLSVEGNLTAQAQVNWVWQVLLGEPLVPTLGLSPDEGLEERTELKAFLAQQWKAHGGDLRKLVAWIACSDAFQRSAETHTASEYAVATQQTIQHWLLQERLFATFATWDREFHDEPKPSLEVVADWLQRSPRLPQGMLAQSPTPDANNNRGEADSVLSRTQLRFITEVRHLPKKADELVDRCLKQGMSWNLARDHAFYAGNTIVPNGRERITADEIYERCGSDTRLAMRHIVCVGLGGQ